MVENNECPECGRYSVKFDPVRDLAYCESSACDFSERVEDKMNFKEKYGTFRENGVV